MKNIQNESKFDREIRFIVGIGSLAASYYTHGSARYFWLAVTVIAFISSLSGFSLFYTLINIKTLKRGQR